MSSSSSDHGKHPRLGEILTVKTAVASPIRGRASKLGAGPFRPAVGHGILPRPLFIFFLLSRLLPSLIFDLVMAGNTGTRNPGVTAGFVQFVTSDNEGGCLQDWVLRTCRPATVGVAPLNGVGELERPMTGSINSTSQIASLRIKVGTHRIFKIHGIDAAFTVLPISPYVISNGGEGEEVRVSDGFLRVRARVRCGMTGWQGCLICSAMA